MVSNIQSRISLDEIFQMMLTSHSLFFFQFTYTVKHRFSQLINCHILEFGLEKDKDGIIRKGPNHRYMQDGAGLLIITLITLKGTTNATFVPLSDKQHGDPSTEFSRKVRSGGSSSSLSSEAPSLLVFQDLMKLNYTVLSTVLSHNRNSSNN